VKVYTKSKVYKRSFRKKSSRSKGSDKKICFKEKWKRYHFSF